MLSGQPESMSQYHSEKVQHRHRPDDECVFQEHVGSAGPKGLQVHHQRIQGAAEHDGGNGGVAYDEPGAPSAGAEPPDGDPHHDEDKRDNSLEQRKRAHGLRSQQRRQDRGPAQAGGEQIRQRNHDDDRDQGGQARPGRRRAG